MSMIFRIARLELSTLFYSPVAWLVLIVFCFQNGLHFTSLLDMMDSQQQAGSELPSLSTALFTSPMYQGVFVNVQQKLFLFIPLLTMGLMSRELGSGSIKLLYSSPVTTTQIVLGKYVAMLMYIALMMLIILVIVITGNYSVYQLDLLYLVGGFVGLYLLASAYAAIGLFMSCLTSYQVVAAIGTLVVLSMLNYVGEVWQDIDFVRDLTYFLSISGRADEMIAGLITSRDVLYFIIIVFLFLTFSILKLQFDRTTVSVSNKTLRYTAVFAAALFFGYISSRPALIGYADLTRDKTRTLTQKSRDIVDKLNGDIEVTTYVNALDQYFSIGKPDQRNSDLARFDMYNRFYPHFKMSYVYYYDSSTNEYLYGNNPGLTQEQLAKKITKAEKMDFGRFLSPEEIKKQVDLEPEGYRFVRKMELGGRSNFLRIFDDMQVFPSEAEISASLKRLMVKPVVVGFLDGYRERSIYSLRDRDYMIIASMNSFRHSLINQGFDVQSIAPLREGIPDSLSVLVIADPIEALDSVTLRSVNNYIDKGGNLLLIADHGRTQFLEPVARKLGISFEKGIIVQTNNMLPADFITNEITVNNDVITDDYPQLKKSGARVAMSGAAGLIYDSTAGFKASVILKTPAAQSWRTSQQIIKENADKRYDTLPGSDANPIVTGLALTKKSGDRVQKIFVAGDADFMSNGEFRRSVPPFTQNLLFTHQIFSWLSDGEYPIMINRPEAQDTRLLVNDMDIHWLKIVFMAILPGLLVFAGAFLLILRMRK